jgi:hypothetical protein
VGLGGTVLLLLAGTQVLDWYWVAGLAAVSLGVGVYQMHKHVPSRYQLAQRIDRRLELADTLSTATYFGEHPKRGYEAVCAVQRREAEGMAGRVDLEAALPLERSRSVYPALGLLLIAAGLFALRFAVLGTLDLKPSLIEMAVDNFFAAPAEEARVKAPRLNLTPQAFDPAQPDAPAPPDDPAFQIPEDAQDASDLMKGDDQQKAGGKNDEGEKGPDNAAQEDAGESDKRGDPQAKQGDKQGDPKDGQDSSENSQDQRSMLDKLRDAVENLLNKMNPKEGNQQNAKNSNRQQKAQKGEKGQKGDEKGESSEGEPQTASGEQGQQSEEQDAKNAQSPGQQRPDENAKSGAGENEGEKTIRDAKMLEAMGKLSELLGRRASEISGQVTIEVGNTKQQLRTAFTQQQAGHGEAGSEIHRDEIPLVHQPFIERYFQEVRKGTPAPATAAAK